MKDTLRILVSWDCNLKCPYCCNEIPEVRERIREVKFKELAFDKYKTICVSGGEPLMPGLLAKTQKVITAAKFDHGKFVVLYTNGIYLNALTAAVMKLAGVDAINVGLHSWFLIDKLIRQIQPLSAKYDIPIRFHAEDVNEAIITSTYPAVEFKFWKRDDCFRENEDIVVLID